MVRCDVGSMLHRVWRTEQRRGHRTSHINTFITTTRCFCCFCCNVWFWLFWCHAKLRQAVAHLSCLFLGSCETFWIHMRTVLAIFYSGTAIHYNSTQQILLFCLFCCCLSEISVEAVWSLSLHANSLEMQEASTLDGSPAWFIPWGIENRSYSATTRKAPSHFVCLRFTSCEPWTLVC